MSHKSLVSQQWQTNQRRTVLVGPGVAVWVRWSDGLVFVDDRGQRANSRVPASIKLLVAEHFLRRGLVPPRYVMKDCSKGWRPSKTIYEKAQAMKLVPLEKTCG